MVRNTLTEYNFKKVNDMTNLEKAEGILELLKEGKYVTKDGSLIVGRDYGGDLKIQTNRVNRSSDVFGRKDDSVLIIDTDTAEELHQLARLSEAAMRAYGAEASMSWAGYQLSKEVEKDGI